MNHTEATLALRRALNDENVSFTTYGLMLAVARRARTVAGLTVDLKLGYQAVSLAIDRAPWFERLAVSGLRGVRLNDDGRTRLARITKRLQAAIPQRQTLMDQRTQLCLWCGESWHLGHDCQPIAAFP